MKALWPLAAAHEIEQNTAAIPSDEMSGSTRSAPKGNREAVYGE